LPGVALKISDLTNSLRECLLAYMVPAGFVFMNGLPLTASGKLDRQALPAPGRSQLEVDAEYVGPQTPIEEVIAGILAGLLKVERVGINDNFFELGGHSLLAMQLIARVRAAFGVTAPLRALLETPTVAGLAAAVEKQFVSAAAGAPPLVRLPQDTVPALSISQEAWLLREWWEDVNLLPARPFHIALAFRLTGDLNVNALAQALNEVIRRHEALQTAFPKTNGMLSWKGLFPVFRKLLALKGPGFVRRGGCRYLTC
jgi:acyl carrier protein